MRKDLTKKSCQVVINKILAVVGAEKINQEIKEWEELLKNVPSNNLWRIKPLPIMDFLQNITQGIDKNFTDLMEQVAMDSSVLDRNIQEVLVELKKSRPASRAIPQAFQPLFFKHMQCVIYLEGCNKKIELCTMLIFKKVFANAIFEYIQLRNFIYGDVLTSLFPMLTAWPTLLAHVKAMAESTKLSQLQRQFTISIENLKMLKELRENLIEALQNGIKNYQQMSNFLKDEQLAAFLTRESLYWAAKINHKCLLAIQKQITKTANLAPEIYSSVEVANNILRNFFTISSENSSETDFLNFIIQTKKSEQVLFVKTLQNPTPIDFDRLLAEAKNAPVYFSEESAFKHKNWLPISENRKFFPILDSLATNLPNEITPQQYSKKDSPKGWKLFSTDAPACYLAVLPLKSSQIRDNLVNLCNQFGNPEIIAKALKSEALPCLALSFQKDEKKLSVMINAIIAKLKEISEQEKIQEKIKVKQLKEISKIVQTLPKIMEVLSQKNRERCSYCKTLFRYIPVVGQYVPTEELKNKLIRDLKNAIKDVSYENLTFDEWKNEVLKIVADPQSKYRKINDLLIAITNIYRHGISNPEATDQPSLQMI